MQRWNRFVRAGPTARGGVGYYVLLLSHSIEREMSHFPILLCSRFFLSSTLFLYFSNARDLLPQIESLPSKAASNRLLIPLAKWLLASSNLSEDHAILTDITFSSKLSSAERETIVLAGITRFSNGSNIDKIAVGEWLASCAKEHAETFKSSILPIMDTLETEQISELEAVSQLALKVIEYFPAIDHRIIKMRK